MPIVTNTFNAQTHILSIYLLIQKRKAYIQFPIPIGWRWSVGCRLPPTSRLHAGECWWGGSHKSSMYHVREATVKKLYLPQTVAVIFFLLSGQFKSIFISAWKIPAGLSLICPQPIHFCVRSFPVSPFQFLTSVTWDRFLKQTKCMWPIG